MKPKGVLVFYFDLHSLPKSIPHVSLQKSSEVRKWNCALRLFNRSV